MKRNILGLIAVTMLVSNAMAADINFNGTDLAAAIAGAASGDRILINTNGPLTVVDLVNADKNLTLEAGVGFSPVITIGAANTATEAGIEVDDSIVNFIGLTFNDGGSTDCPILKADDATAVVTLTNCTIDGASSHGIIIQDGATVNVVNSLISNSTGDGIFLDTDGILTVTGSTIDGGGRNIQFDSTTPDNLSMNVTLTNSRFLNADEEAIMMDDNSPSGTSTGNVLIIDGCDILGNGVVADGDAILIDDGDVEFTTLHIINNHISPSGTGGAGIKLDNKWAEVNSSTTLISNNLIWYPAVNVQSGIQVENFTGNVEISNNTIYNFGEGGIVVDRPSASAGTLTITGNLIIEWDETIYTVPTDNIGHGINDENGAGAGVTSDNNVLVDSSNSQFFIGVTPGSGDTTGSDPLAHVASTNSADANFLARLGTAGSTLSGTSAVSDWANY